MAIDKIVVVNSFTAFMYEVEEKIKQGYSLSTTDCPVNSLFYYEAFLEKEIPDEAPEIPKFVEKPVARKPKLSADK